jgi:hypothetical protein
MARCTNVATFEILPLHSEVVGDCKRQQESELAKSKLKDYEEAGKRGAENLCESSHE